LGKIAILADMAITSRLLASGAGWQVRDVVCTAGPQDRPFEEEHHVMCLALVTDGSFQYRTSQGSSLMTPGSVLLGNAGAAYECGHEHHAGDRCLAFQFAPQFFESIVVAVPDATQFRFREPRLPLLPQLLPLVAAAQSMRDEPCDWDEVEELAMRFAGAVCAAVSMAKSDTSHARAASLRDERRVTTVLRRIEAMPSDRHSLRELAQEAAMSPYHLLRVFEQVVGVTPHQYLLRTRLRQAAVRLRRSRDSVAAVAGQSGFNDLSTFNRQFRRLIGASPTAYRARAAFPWIRAPDVDLRRPAAS
jgi:AraC family transcriptional regulator